MPFDGMSLGRYKLIRILGRGGMGEVYLADDPRMNRQVAIKVMRGEASAYPNLESAKHAALLFEREMQTISSLDHPHILPIFDYGEDTIEGISFTYMVMPYRTEGALDTWLRERTSTGLLSPQEVAEFIMQIGSALQHAHERHVIHQDVKPSNFLVRLNEERPQLPDLFLADFGVARFTSATSNSSQTIRGTPTYMAPEQWEGQPTYATDQYALAIMAYELLVGRPPFDGGPSPMMFKHMTVQPVAPTSMNPYLPSGLDAVVLRGLAKNPAGRYPNVLEFARDFQRAAWAGESSHGVISGSNLPTLTSQAEMETIVNPLVSSGDYQLPGTADALTRTQQVQPTLNQETRISSARSLPEDPLDGRTILPGKSILLPSNGQLAGYVPAPPVAKVPLEGRGHEATFNVNSLHSNVTESYAPKEKKSR
ncbi:MAG TPA: serine/threonine-protein kinase, partial [Ktedonobacteraceae bacterium]|nr:serine/threonine-protein kinase [Ktedonobacteraceae bacterium]